MTTAMQEIIEVRPISTSSAIECQREARDLLEEIKNIVIKDQESYERTAYLLSRNKTGNKRGEIMRKAITNPIDVARKAAMDLFRNVVAYYDEGERIAKQKMIAYTTEQERIRLEQEEKLRKEAAAKEAAEKKRLEERADKAEASGKVEKAEELRQQAEEVFVPAPTVAPTVQKVAGISMKQNWKARIIDINKVPREYMIVNESMLDKMAKATKGSLEIPGVQFYPENVLASR